MDGTIESTDDLDHLIKSSKAQVTPYGHIIFSEGDLIVGIGW
jgi:hypothetical protein